MMDGMEGYYFLFGLALVWIIFAVVQDLRRREVSDWLNFSLVAFALAYRAFYSAHSDDWMFLAYGVLGFALFYGLANLFYYSGVFAGGDAKLLMGIGAVLPYSSFSDFAFIGLGFIVLLFVAGAVYSLAYSLFIVSLNYKKFVPEFKKNLGKKTNWVFALVFGLLFIILIYVVFGMDFVLLLISILFAVFIFVLFAYAKSLEVCMIRLVSPSFLSEGDWLVSDIKIAKGKIVKKTVHGLSANDIISLRKYGKKVLIKEGIPFTPAFLITFLIMVFFWEAWEYLILGLF
ncbi:MAG: A24 family peptidase [Candidatus Pacearchaeota archaeon]